MRAGNASAANNNTFRNRIGPACHLMVPGEAPYKQHPRMVSWNLGIRLTQLATFVVGCFNSESFVLFIGFRLMGRLVGALQPWLSRLALSRPSSGGFSPPISATCPVYSLFNSQIARRRLSCAHALCKRSCRGSRQEASLGG